jgi:RNA recognition motif-containing protein
VKNIYVGNLHSETTEQSIRSFFEPVGTVRNVKLMLDKKTGLSRGLAFIEMDEPEAAKAVATLHGKVLDGRAIDVHEGRQKVHGLASPGHDIRHAAAADHP